MVFAGCRSETDRSMIYLVNGDEKEIISSAHASLIQDSLINDNTRGY